MKRIFAVVFLLPMLAWAQSYPAKPVRLIVDGGFDVVASSPEEFLRFVQGESDKLGRLIRDNGIRVQ